MSPGVLFQAEMGSHWLSEARFGASTDKDSWSVGMRDVSPCDLNGKDDWDSMLRRTPRSVSRPSKRVRTLRSMRFRQW